MLKLSQCYNFNFLYISLIKLVLIALLHGLIFFLTFSSPHCWGKGGCDEEISIFLYRWHVDKEIITQLQGKPTGLHEHGELIKVRVVPYKKLWRTTADSKVLMAVALLEMAMKEGLLPPFAT